MAKLRKTLFLSETNASGRPERRYQAPYIFYDRPYRKWRQDLWYFDDKEVVSEQARAKGYIIR